MMLLREQQAAMLRRLAQPTPPKMALQDDVRSLARERRYFEASRAEEQLRQLTRREDKVVGQSARRQPLPTAPTWHCAPRSAPSPT
jgi:hypothetical protein